MGDRIKGTLGDRDPLNKVPFKRAISRVQKGPSKGVSLILPRSNTATMSKSQGFRVDNLRA